MRVKWIGVFGLAMILSVIFGGTSLYVFKDRLLLTPVVVTVETIPECSPIPSSAIKVVKLPHMGVPPDTARSMEDVNRLWTNCGYSVPKNGFIYLSHVTAKKEMKVGWMDQAAPNERLVTIPVDRATSLGGQIDRGDYVDIWFVSKRQASGTFVGKLFNKVLITQLLDANGNKMGEKTQARQEPKKGLLSLPSVPNPSPPASLTLRIKETDIPYLLSARKEGTLMIVGRGKNAGESSNYPKDAKQWLRDRWQGKEGD